MYYILCNYKYGKSLLIGEDQTRSQDFICHIYQSTTLPEIHSLTVFGIETSVHETSWP